MNITRNYRIRLTLLSPLHIGSGHKINKNNYYYHNGNIYIISEQKFLNWIKNNNKLDQLLMLINKLQTTLQFNGWADLLKTSALEIKINKDFLSSVSSRVIKADSGVGEFSAFINDTVSASHYIPGSSVKGALRNGFLEEKWKDDKVYFEECFKKSLQYNQFPKETGKYINEKCNTAPGKYSPQKDVFRTLSVSDLYPCSVYESRVQRVKVLKFQRDGNCKDLFEDLEGNPSFELIMPPAAFCGTISIDQFTPVEEKLSLNKIIQYSHKKTMELLEREKVFYENYHQSDLVDFHDILIKQGANLRLGAGVGWQTFTLGSLLSEQKRLNLGNRIRKRINKNHNYSGLEFPCTRKIFENKDGARETLGWAKIELLEREGLCYGSIICKYRQF